MSLRLRIEHGQDAGTTYRLPAAGVYTLGRVPQNSVRVLDMKVSKTHCELRVSGEGANLKCMLHDPGSTHGCELNGQPVPKGKDVPMRPGDELRLGLTILRLLSAGDSDQDAKPVEGRTVDAGGAGGDSKEAASTPTLPADELVGKKLGGYQVEKKIGAGGMGGVYLAEQVSLNRQVALKVLNETFAADSAFVDQFVNEARAAGALNHPNVVQVYDVGSDQGRYFFSMEVMPGGSIEEKLREGPIAWEEGLNYFIDAANALIFANKREILHRDVKPDNLMISEDDSAKLCDLGLAKKSEVSDLMDQGIIGTPHFISPEAIRRKPDIDHRTDLYSLGCTFYRIFTGKNPYPAGTVKEILLGHLNKPVPHVNEINRDVPREIDEVVAQLMAKDPGERIQTPDELLRELDKIRTKYNLEAHGIKPASRKPLIIGGVLAAAAIGVAIFFAMKDPGPSGPGEISDEDQARIDRARRAGVESELKQYVSGAVTAFAKLELERAKGDLGPENYKNASWTTLAGKYKDSAKEWQGKRDAWTKAQGETKDAVIKGYYGDYGTQLDAEIAKAKRVAKDEIEAKIQALKDSETARAEARTTALSDAEKGIADYARKLKTLEDGGYPEGIELEKTVRSAELADLLKELLARDFKGFKLVTQKDLDPLLAKNGLKQLKDAPRGIEAVNRVVKRIDGKRKEFLAELPKKLGNPPTHAGYKAAKDLAQAVLDSLPAGFEAEQQAAPFVVAALKKLKEEADRRLGKLKADHIALADREFAADRAAYFTLIKALWNPESGYLPRFDFAQARALIERTEKKLKVDNYKSLATNWLPLIDALERLFQRTIEGKKKGEWVDDDFMGVDRKGRPKKMRIRDISAEGVSWEKTPVPFHRTSPRFLLENLFFFEGKPRLKSCDAADHAGLGLLAELAGRYDIAGAQYQAAATGDEALRAAAVQRMKALETERQAAEKFFAVLEFAQALDAWATPFEELVAKLSEDPDAFPKEERERLEAERVEREQLMAQMRANLDDLRGKAALAKTMWGSSLREEMHEAANYAGEAPPAKKAPRKPNDPPKDDAPKKDADSKKDGNGGADGE